MMFPAPEVDAKLRIYCNRSLNMKNIKAVGFDMDYTLSLYHPETFEGLAYQETLKKLVTLGYPDLILGWKFDPDHMIRGLVIDKKNGNILKMDRHRYIKLAYHGFEPITREERHQRYHGDSVLSYEEPDFALVDTLFTLADAFLFSQLVALKERSPKLIKKSFPELYKDVRNAIDLCHRDGSIKLQVAKDPTKYIKKDPEFRNCLQKIKEAGKQLFVVTNSLWDYTNVVMNHLFGNPTGHKGTEWVELFDLVITGSAKPAFFMSQNPLFGVDLESGYLKNVESLQTTQKVFQGGNYRQLHEYLKIGNGSQVLYVGDHIYGDILRSKKELGWRTMLVITELEREIQCLSAYSDEHKRYEDLLEIKDSLDDEIQRLTTLKQSIHGKEALDGMIKKIASVQAHRLQTRETLRKNLHDYHVKFHPIWGELMKTGQQNSRFAAQVENYACLYTSKFTNLIHYSLNKGFNSTRDYMPHDLP